MRHVMIENFAKIGNWSVPADVVAISISSDSEIDVCDIHGVRLGVGGVLPVSQGAVVSCPYGWNTDPTAFKIINGDSVLTTNQPNVFDFDGTYAPLPARLSLILWQCNDVIAPPPRRAARRFNAEFSETVTLGSTEFVCLFRVPYFGRVGGKVNLLKLGGTLMPSQLCVRAVTYFDRKTCEDMNLGTRSKKAPYTVEDFTALYQEPVASAMIATAIGTIASDVSLGSNFGGDGDARLLADEIQVWVNTGNDDNLASDKNINFMAQVEVWGDR